jgi:hypothetical protein
MRMRQLMKNAANREIVIVLEDLAGRLERTPRALNDIARAIRGSPDPINDLQRARIARVLDEHAGDVRRGAQHVREAA